MNIYHLDDIPDHLKQFFRPVPQIGLEATPEEYTGKMVEVFREVRRVLADDGTLWLNLGDSYTSGGRDKWNSGDNFLGQHSAQDGMARPQIPAGLKPKDLVGVPWRVAFALQADGWYLRSDIIWHKPNPMPESVTDRPTKAHEYLFLLSKSERYYYNAEAIAEPAGYAHEACLDPGTNGLSGQDRKTGRTTRRFKSGNKTRDIPTAEDGRGIPNDHLGRGVPWEGVTRNRRSVWTVATQPYAGAHFATFPVKLVEPCILAGCPEGGTVLDPFVGSGTVLQVAMDCVCKSIGIELNPAYAELCKKRLEQGVLEFEPTA